MEKQKHAKVLNEKKISSKTKIEKEKVTLKIKVAGKQVPNELMNLKIQVKASLYL